MKKFVVTEGWVSGVKVIQLCPIVDERGSLTRLFCFDELLKIGWMKPVRNVFGTEGPLQKIFSNSILISGNLFCITDEAILLYSWVTQDG